ncbi:MAG: peptidase family [Frankiales bacterium]|nr:peptidase family [Frankiales bacterium]
MLSLPARPDLTRRPLPRTVLPALLLVVGGGALTALATQATAQDEPAPAALTSSVTGPTDPAALDAGPRSEENQRASRSRTRIATPVPAPVAPPAPVVEPVPAPVVKSPSPKPSPSGKPSPSPAATRQAPARAAAAPAAPAGSGGACPVPNATFVDSWGDARSGGRAHKGTDMMAPGGSPVYAVRDGVVRTTSSSAGGLSIYLTADDGMVFFYAHNSANVASSGQRVQAGQLIARVGSTGNASAGATHVHFEMQPGGGGAVPSYRFLSGLC